MKGHRPRLSPDPAAAHRAHVAWRDATHERVDAIRIEGWRPVLHVSAEFKKRLDERLPAEVFAGEGLLPFTGIPIVVSPHLPTYRKRRTPAQERRRRRQRFHHMRRELAKEVAKTDETLRLLQEMTPAAHLRIGDATRYHLPYGGWLDDWAKKLRTVW